MEQVHLSSTWKMTSLSAFTRNRGMSIQYGNGPFIDGESVKISFQFEFLPLGRMNADSDFAGASGAVYPQSFMISSKNFTRESGMGTVESHLSI